MSPADWAMYFSVAFGIPAFVLVRYRKAIATGTLCRAPEPAPEPEPPTPPVWGPLFVAILKLAGGALIIGIILAAVAFVGMGALGLLLFGVRSLRG